MNNNVERNNNGVNAIQGVSDNSFMHRCYLGSLAKVTGADILDFLQGFIKDLKGEVGMIYSKDSETGEIQGMLAIGYKANSQGRQQQNMNGMIPIPGINSSRGGKINEAVLKSIDRIKMPGYGPSVLNKEDAILFRVDLAAIVAEMMNPTKGYAVSIDDVKMHGTSDITVLVSVYKSKNVNNVNRMTKILQSQGSKFNNRPQNQNQPQRYNGGRR
jgi:hypothetical protein